MIRVRSVLFGPASRVDFVEKFAAAGADVGVLDLEDATPENGKADARAVLASSDVDQIDRGAMKLLVRTNSIGTSHFADDVAAAADAGVDGIVVPKLEADREVQDVREAMESAGIIDGILCGGIESVAGVHRAIEVCGAGLDFIYFGAEDFITDIGGRRTASNSEVLYARSQVVIAARLAGIPATDQVVVDYGDSDRFEREAGEARDLGYSGKLCIHPGQVALANAAFTPSDGEVEWARGLLAVAEEAEAAGQGVASYEGTMVDAPIILRARSVLHQTDTEL